MDGVAERGADGITVMLKAAGGGRPSRSTRTSCFPTEQVRRIIEAARAGQEHSRTCREDGSDNGEKVYNTLTVIGQPIPGDRTPKQPDVSTGSNALKSMTRWPVTVSYYDRAAKQDAGEQTPAYAMSFELYEDGVSRALVLDYNDFVIAGAMDKLDVKDSKPCK